MWQWNWSLTMREFLQRYFETVARKSKVNPQLSQKYMMSLSAYFDRLKVFKLWHWGSDSLQIQLVNGNARKAGFFHLSPYMLA
jgi:hypothetical protein